MVVSDCINYFHFCRGLRRRSGYFSEFRFLGLIRDFCGWRCCRPLVAFDFFAFSIFLVLFFFLTLIRGCSAPKRKPVSRILGKADMNQA